VRKFVNQRNGFGSRDGRFKRPFSDRPQAPRREPARTKVEDSSPSEPPDDSVTGCERRYLESLVMAATPLVVVLQQGDQIVGRLAWYDQACLKVKPADGSPSLLIPKANIKYLYEESATQPIA
jgi:hypothetical protein